jgi:hypothetical protein
MTPAVILWLAAAADLMMLAWWKFRLAFGPQGQHSWKYHNAQFNRSAWYAIGAVAAVAVGLA